LAPETPASAEVRAASANPVATINWVFLVVFMAYGVVGCGCCVELPFLVGQTRDKVPAPEFLADKKPAINLTAGEMFDDARN
jgi:hypothetical protein